METEKEQKRDSHSAARRLWGDFNDLLTEFAHKYVLKIFEKNL